MNVGALIGELNSGSVKNAGINNSKTTDGVALSGNLNVGGLVVYNKGSIAGHASGGIKGTGDYIGGLVGYNGGSGTVTGYATGAVSGNDNVGGLVGFNSGPVTCYATGAVSGSDNVGGQVGYNVSGGTITGCWDLETTSDGSSGIGISSTANIYYYTATTEPSGRVQNMYYDKGTGAYLYSKDSGDSQIFNDGDFASIFELPKADGVWPKLEKSFTVEDRTITLPKAIYDAQEGIVNWPAE